ncbi:substrate-binding domain-containing protein [Acerihabitans sp. KWT182]|uniref:Substrate-binding domain-containing protein n=1 Tax=Acerihabitans sp. KWT182 TaxID=3157919 RepID=A0AAU7QCN1_9GAMM
MPDDRGAVGLGGALRASCLSVGQPYQHRFRHLGHLAYRLGGVDFNRRFPEVGIQIQATGSATAAAALAAGTAQLGPMSRAMTGTEIAAFRRHYGYSPSAVPVALDAVVILVNQDNPCNPCR